MHKFNFTPILLLSLLFLLPAEIALATTVYVGNAQDNIYGKSVDIAAIDATTNQLIAYIPAGDYPANVIASPDGKTVYVCNQINNSISVVDSATQTIIRTIPILTNPSAHTVALALNASSTVLYAAVLDSPSYGNSVIQVININSGAITQIPFNTVRIVGSNFAFSQDGKKGYIIANSYPYFEDSEVLAFDTTTNQPLSAILNSTSINPYAYVASANTSVGNFLYIPYNYYPQPTQIEVINLATNTITASIKFSSGNDRVLAIASNPAGTAIYVTILAVNPSGIYENYLYAIDTKTNSITNQALITSDYDLTDLVISGDGEKIYASASPNLQNAYATVDGVYEIDAASLKVLNFTSLKAKKIYPQGITLAN